MKYKRRVPARVLRAIDRLHNRASVKQDEVAAKICDEILDWAVGGMSLSHKLDTPQQTHTDRERAPMWLHTLDTYYQPNIGRYGRYVLPDGAAQVILAYQPPRCDPQATLIVRLAGETNSEAAAAWAEEYLARYLERVEVLACSENDRDISLALLAQSFASTLPGTPHD